MVSQLIHKFRDLRCSFFDPTVSGVLSCIVVQTFWLRGKNIPSLCRSLFTGCAKVSFFFFFFSFVIKRADSRPSQLNSVLSDCLVYQANLVTCYLGEVAGRLWI